MGAVALGARGRRSYGLYICSTQEQADDHVATISAMLESPEVAAGYPAMSDRSLSKFGTSRGWRRNRLWTASGFIIDAIGLDATKRGAKLGSQRPDFLIFDDLDGELDSAKTTDDNLARISKKLLPAGSDNVAVIAIQNLVIPNGIFARLARADGATPTDILNNRIISGPIPALRNLVYESGEGGIRLTAGDPTWEGQSLETCQAQATEWGLSAFLQEAQHEVDSPSGGMFEHVNFRHAIETNDGKIYHATEHGAAIGDAVHIVRGCVWVDPAVTDTDRSDAHGICAAGLGENGVVYVLRAYEQRTSPLDSLKRAIGWCRALGFDRLGVETDQGGDAWFSVFQQACFALGIPLRDQPAFVSDKAGAGHGPKAHRASQLLADYERGRVVHVMPAHLTMERALRRFGVVKPYDLADAAYWCWDDLRRLHQGQKKQQFGEVVW